MNYNRESSFYGKIGHWIGKNILLSFWRTIFVFVIVGITTSDRFNLTMNKDVWFCFFSSTAQTFAALIALLAVFLISRLEYYRLEIKGDINHIYSLITDPEKVPLSMSKDELKKIADTIWMQSKYSEGIRLELKKTSDRIEYLEQKEKNAKDLMATSITLTFIIIILSIFLIPLGSWSTESSSLLNLSLNFPWLKWGFIYSVVGLCMTSLYRIVVALEQFLSEEE